MRASTAVSLLLLLLGVGLSLADDCIRRELVPGNIECVCNATQCISVPPLEPLPVGTVAWYASTASGDRFHRRNLVFKKLRSNGSFKNLPATGTVISVDAARHFQEINGFGGAFTDATGSNLVSLSQRTQKRFLELYFGQSGIQYTLGRVPIAGTDFSSRLYTDDDVQSDFAMANFSLTREDTDYKIPFIRKALTLSKGSLRLFATAWSAPGWMKDNNSTKGGGRLKRPAGGAYFQAYANYFVRWFEKYHAKGIKFWAVTPENEPFVEGPYETMLMPPSDQLAYIVKNLGPALKANPVTKNLLLLLHDDNKWCLNQSVALLSDPKVNYYVSGVAFHWYGPKSYDELEKTHTAFPKKFLLSTEACNGVGEGWKGSWQLGVNYAIDILNDIEHWTTGWVDWNMLLDEEGGPNWVGNFNAAPVLANATKDEFYLQPSFFALGHFSKFIPPGSTKTASTVTPSSAHILAQSFLTPDSLRVLVVINTDAKNAQTVTIQDTTASSSVTTVIDANSFNTFVWKPNK